MFSDMLFFVYILASFAGLLVVILAALLIRYWSKGNQRMLCALLGFEICNVVIAAMYFCYYFMQIKMNSYSSHALIRILDMWMYIGQAVFWSLYIREKSQSVILRSKKLKIGIITALFAVAAFLYGFLLDGYYDAGAYLVPAVLLELVLSAVSICIILVYTWKGLQRILIAKIRYLMIAIVALTIIDHLWNMALTVTLMAGRDLLVSIPNADLTPVMILAVSILVLILLISEDFSSLFVRAESMAAEKEDAGEVDTEGKLNMIAVEHMLTEREREVLFCAYQGMTNPQIAAQLHISQSTVKRHMHNVFEKIDVKSRIELIHMVNGWIDTR